MTGRILPFPTPAPAASGLRKSCNFALLVELCGLAERDTRTQVDMLRRLARTDGLPLPTNPRYWAGKRQLGPASIGQLSVWDGAEVAAWLAGQGSNAEPARIAHPAGAQPGLRAAMRGRARQLKARS